MSSIAIAYRRAARVRRIASIALSILTIVLSIGILAIFITQPEIFLSTGTSGLNRIESVFIDAREYLLFLPMIALVLLFRMPKSTTLGRSPLTVPLVFGIVAAGLCFGSYVYPQAVVMIGMAFFFVGVLSSGLG